MIARNLALLAVAAAALVSAGCRSAPDWMQNGMQAPDLSGTTVDGQPVRLADARGRPVAVFFFADWCPHCRALYADERELATRCQGGKMAMIGVVADNTPAEIRDAIHRERITWPVIYDAGSRNSTAWGITGLPTTYLLDGNGTIRGFDLKGSSLMESADALIAEQRTAR